MGVHTQHIKGVLKMVATKLKNGDEIRVISPSRSLSVIKEEKIKEAVEFLESQGFKVTFSKNSRKIDKVCSSDIKDRVADLHEAFLDKNVKAILTSTGGFNVNQILEYIDYDIIKNNPKIICGYSDITALLNAIYAKTGLVTYHGLHFSSFKKHINREYSNDMFRKCVCESEQYDIYPSNKEYNYEIVQDGKAEGTIVGGNLCTLNLLQGTEFMPDLEEKILFLEDDNIVGDLFSYEFERNLQSLLQVKGTDKLRGVVFGRFSDDCNMTIDVIRRMVRSKKQLKNVPIISNVEFGHLFPIITFPIGGKVIINTQNENHIKIISH